MTARRQQKHVCCLPSFCLWERVCTISKKKELVFNNGEKQRAITYTFLKFVYFTVSSVPSCINNTLVKGFSGDSNSHFAVSLLSPAVP